ncbi:uncharacterized protein [Amphiura filiformis]|uniref:uncharacterized protein isoform X2 n=1 Tax=Amphiura filiformis TaxID=82378 RepID=UPI003B220AF7
MAASEAQFVFGFVGFVTLAVLVVGDRCYQCTTEHDRWPPQCQKMDNFTLDCVRDVELIYGFNNTCQSGDRYIDTRLQFFHSGGEARTTGVRPKCVTADITCVSEETLLRRFQEEADGTRFTVEATGEKIIPDLINGTVCYCQTSPCTEEGMIPSTPDGGGPTRETTTPVGDAAIIIRSSYTVMIISVIFVIVVLGCNLGL